MKASNNHHNAHAMNTNLRELISQRWNAVQYVLIPELSKDFGEMTPKLEQLTHTLEWVRPEAYCTSGCGKGRKPHERAWIASAFVAKAVLGVTTRA